MNEPDSLKQRKPELDGIRGIAICLVLLLHILLRPNIKLFEVIFGQGVARVLNSTWVGVDFFFVLSGYLIGGIILDNRDSPNFFKVFYRRRIARILPLYILLLTLSEIPLFGRSQIKEGAVPLWAYLTFIANFWTSTGHNFCFFLGPLWSVCIEEQFYLAAPALLRTIKLKLIPFILILVAIGSASLRTAMCIGWIPWLKISQWDFTFTRLDGISLGIIVAWVMRDKIWRWRVTKARSLLRVMLILTTIIFCICVQGHSWSRTGVGIFVASCAASILIVLAVSKENSFTRRALSIYPLPVAGRYSYFLYLFHMPMLWLTYFIPRPYPLLWMIPFTALWIIAAFSYHFVEKPILTWGRNISYA